MGVLYQYFSASTDAEAARTVIKLYGRLWGIESGFRDTKDLRYGMGMGIIRSSTPDRRDRLLLLNAFAVALLTLLGAAGEDVVPHHLALSGDTMEMLRAVLDTNLWLATHVVVITIGYASMFVAGLPWRSITTVWKECTSRASSG